MLGHLPKDDGITHINIYSKGQTELGRLLSNFSRTPFTNPKYGEFTSVEGFWYYISSGFKYEELRTMFGYQAKMCGRRLEVVHTDKFEELIRESILLKLEQTPGLMEMFKNSQLPLTHYYYYGTVDRWVDGDTISAKIDLGFRIIFTEKFRLARINTPEKGQPGYIEAIARVNQLCPVNSTVTITCHGYDRYGRWISDIVNKDGVNVNDVLLQEGLAKPYM